MNKDGRNGDSDRKKNSKRLINRKVLGYVISLEGESEKERNLTETKYEKINNKIRRKEKKKMQRVNQKKIKLKMRERNEIQREREREREIHKSGEKGRNTGKEKYTHREIERGNTETQ